MKKFFATLMALCFTLSPVITFAATEGLTKVDIKDYETLNLQEALEAEEIKPAFKSYSENDDQITIYLFRGQGCGYCQGFLKFLNSITNEYGKYFKLVSFDAWYIEENAELLTNVSEFLGQPAEGVPYVIIGDQVFPGYAEDYNEGIKAAITTLYNAKDKYDVFISNPKLVNVGINMAWCGTYIVYMPSYRVDVITQATHRGYRANSQISNRFSFRVCGRYFRQTCG